MRVASLVSLAIIAFADLAHAGTAEVGRGLGATSIAPLYYVSPSPDDAGASRLLYRKADLVELPPGVPITAIELDKRLGSALAGTTFTVYLKSSTATSLANAPLSDALAGATQVYTSSAFSLPATDGWVRIDLATPFTYTGDALEVVTVWDSMSGARPDDLHWGFHTTGAINTRLFNYAPQPLLPTDILGTGSPPQRPNIRFVFTTPATGWLVVEAGTTPLLNGATYSNTASMAPGIAVPQYLHLTNNGGAPINLGAVTFSNIVNVTPLVVVGPPATLAAGASADVQLSHAAIASPGTASYTVSIASDGPGPFVYSVTGSVFPGAAPEIDLRFLDVDGRFAQIPNNSTLYLGNQAIGVDRVLTGEISNYGTATLNLTGNPDRVQIVGSTNATVTITKQPDAAVPPGGDAQSTVRVRVNTEGPFSTTVRVINNDSTESSYTVSLSGRGVLVVPTAPEIALSRGGTSLPDGGQDYLGILTAMTTVNYTVSNPGQERLNFSTPDISNQVNCVVAALGHSTSVVAGGSEEIPLQITPRLAGPFSFTLSIPNDDGNGDEIPYDLAVDGIYDVPPVPEIRLSNVGGFEIPNGNTVTLDGVNQGEFSIQIENIGGADLELDDMTWTIDPEADTTEPCLISNVVQPQSPVPPGQITRFTFRIALNYEDRSPEGLLRCTVHFTLPNNDDDENPSIVHVYMTVPFGEEDYGCNSCRTSGRAIPWPTLVLFAMVLGFTRRRRRDRE